MTFRTPTAAAKCTTRSTWPIVSFIIGQFRMESTIRWSEGWSRTSARLSRLPVDRLSTTKTLLPASSRRATRWEPMKPAPPVTKMESDMRLRTYLNRPQPQTRYAPLSIRWSHAPFSPYHPIVSASPSSNSTSGPQDSSSFAFVASTAYRRS